MDINRKFFAFGFIVFFVNLLSGFIYILDFDVDFFVWSITTAVFLYLHWSFDAYTPVKFVTMLGGLALYTFPYLGLYFLGISVDFYFYPLYLLLCFLVIVLSEGVFRPFDREAFLFGRYHYVFFGVFFSASLLSALFAPVLYLPFLGILYIFVERAARDSDISNLKFFFLVSLVYFVILFNMIFLWSGFGRLGILVQLIVPLIILHIYGRFELKPQHLLLLCPPALVYALGVRGDYEFTGLGGFASGSAVHHLILMDELSRNVDQFVTRTYDLFDQFILLVLNWAPRFVWENKPVGIGLYFVDEYIGRDGFSDGHSVSIGFWGEHLYLFPKFWLVSGIFTLVVVMLLARILYLITGNSVSVLVVFYSHLIVLIWGGMAAFGSRVWWLILPMIAFILFEKVIKRTQK